MPGLTHPSPNYGARRGGMRPGMIVLHYTGMASCEAALARLCDPAAEVSAHYLIAEAGEVLSLVEEAERAWHAGAGAWGGVTDVNSASIGIELANPGDAPFAARQMQSLERLLAEVMTRWSIPPARVIGHSDMAPARKRDPGQRFDWRALALYGLSVWPEPRESDPSGADPSDAGPAGFRAAARAFGWPDVADDLLLGALRLRFRPWARGPLDAVDAGIAADLAARFPVDPSPASA
jgi:N-acetylmuramoyl-L-alanine amidase